MRIQFRHYVLAFGAFLFGVAISTLPAFASAGSGIIGLYNASDPKAFDQALRDAEPELTSKGCGVSRVGEVAGVQADIGLGDVNRLIHVTCRSTILDNAMGRAVLDSLSSAASRVALLEGRYLDGPLDNGAPDGRAYILKLSRYSNSDPNARDADLAALDRQVAGLDDVYQNEVYLEVHRAMGMPTPDEAVLLYYPSSEAGERFRANNQSLLEKIGRFNRAHLTEFAYYLIKPIR
ncbi:MAG: hypothetical protein P1U69_07105 [Parvibaculaceae bacterium]|nr:hypothetical protein [Parvibaculaceae bacterium]HBM87082.1 hypothetical protein [Rhodobiaceae bacterium]|tara:strand:- start:2003 stop:2707 length:705 start_codon:yes stop_codon:yes gene_type:complete